MRYFEEFIQMSEHSNPKCLGVRVLETPEPGRSLDSYGRRTYVLTEDVALVRGSGKPSVAKKGMRVMTMVHAY